ncbi:MAG: hypothetical protein IJ680_05965 [Paludibacteraceae bacterium]|nr:hypothetical protein [Paludibacteraceae bacterium]
MNDCAYPIGDHIALGFCLNGGGGFRREYKKYSDVDHFHIVFRLTAGLMMQIGGPQNKPWLLGLHPVGAWGLWAVRFGYGLPVEARLGKFVTDRWYVMGCLTSHESLARETATIGPAMHVGYSFGRKVRTEK